MTRSTNNPEADYTPNDMGLVERRLSHEEEQRILELKQDWEDGIINEVIWAETEQNLKKNKELIALIKQMP